MTFGTPVPITAGTTYVASYYAPAGHYAGDSQFFAASDYRSPPLTAPGGTSAVLNGVYADGHGFPSQSYKNTNYWVDVLYSRDDTTPPSIATTSPLAGASSVASTVKPSATFVGTVDPATVNLTLKDASNNSVVGTSTFDAASRTARFTPSAALTKGASYTATITASSAAGTPMPAPYSWSFTISQTDPLPGICPCSVWPDSATPAVASASDTGSVQLGVKFTADVDGSVTGVRFFKGTLNVGTHTGSLWSAAGAQLATVTFSNETTSGWQTAYFTSPVDITAGTTYIVSYAAPNGGYAVTSGGLSAAVDSPPLHTIAGGSVYTYGSGAPLTSSSDNYWVDLVFMANDAAPAVASTSPADSSTNVNIASAVSATLSGHVQSGTAKLVVKDPAGTTVAGAATFDAASNTVTFSPTSALSAGTTYTATVSGATALSGFVMSPYTWQFTTAGTTCPCTLFGTTQVPGTTDSGDGGSVELGVSFTAAVDGQVTGVRFYKSSLNIGTHVGNLWSASGQLLATGMFTGESASGWQTLTFPAPVAISAGTTYVASYYAPNGHYAASGQFFAGGYSNGLLQASSANGLYRYGSASGFPTDSYGATNYWVDPIFNTGTPPDVTPPTVSATSPISGATSQPASTNVRATFSEPIDSSTVSFTVKTGAGVTVGGSTATTTRHAPSPSPRPQPWREASRTTRRSRPRTCRGTP